MANIAIFASGSGTNAENLIKFYKNSEINVVRLYCNNKNAGVIERAKQLQVPVFVFTKQELHETSIVSDMLKSEHIDYIILSGFLLLMPKAIIQEYHNKIINIHPALLPNYGGKGMFGSHVHEAVIAHNEKESGITIHLVNEVYDSGKTIFQARCNVLPNDTPDSLAHRVHELEYQYFPQIVKDYILGKL